MNADAYNPMSEISLAYELGQEQKREDFTQKRKALREKLLSDLILGESVSLVFTSTFDGSGDSGQYNNEAGNKEVDELLADAVDLFVTFEWADGQGGGGDITWDVLADKIVINGYYNETVQRDAMTEEEF